MNPDLDLQLSRVIRAPRARVWQAWTDPASLERWFLPAPTHCRVERLEPRAGGAFLTQMRDEDGAAWGPHLDGCFLAAEPDERLVFTTAIAADWRPASPTILMTAEVTLADHADGTDYRVLVRHADPAARAQHEELGFELGWGTVTSQLAELAEQG
ncbi:MAG: SRPBCC domain-containing protein [Solirubrobacteraceae bacterium]|nr:SRPBCC domain-containing protein [Solirubrobacteraceae bacterium]